VNKQKPPTIADTGVWREEEILSVVGNQSKPLITFLSQGNNTFLKKPHEQFWRYAGEDLGLWMLFIGRFTTKLITLSQKLSKFTTMIFC